MADQRHNRDYNGDERGGERRGRNGRGRHQGGGYRRRGEERSGERRYDDRRQGGRQDGYRRRDDDRRPYDRDGRRHDGERQYGERDRHSGDRRGGGYRRRDEGHPGGRRDGDNRYEGRREGGRHSERDRRDGDRRPEDSRRGQGRRTHANRGGAGRSERRGLHAQRPGFREERIKARAQAPAVPSDLDIKDLDPMVLQDLKVLAKDNADMVAKHMLMAAIWMSDDPQLALQHARAAKDRGGRVSVVRETLGIAAYHAGEWKEALSELRAARRMSGGPGLVAVMADCERGLGRPEKAIEFAREEDTGQLDLATRIELGIVVAGARHDLGQIDAAIVELERLQPSRTKKSTTWARLSYAYADLLTIAGRMDEAREWFAIAHEQDEEGFLDAEERLKELG